MMYCTPNLIPAKQAKRIARIRRTISTVGFGSSFVAGCCVFQGSNVTNGPVVIGSKVSNPSANHGNLMWDKRTFHAIKEHLKK